MKGQGLFGEDRQTQLDAAGEFLLERVAERPRWVVVLGSGLALDDRWGDLERVPYGDIPGFPRSTVPGHPGQVSWSPAKGTVFFEGRFHLYEGCTHWEVAFPVRLAAALGADGVILTNAAGALNPDYSPGQLMLIRDHINLTGSSPLLGLAPGADLSPFVDLSDAYAVHLRERARQVSREAAVEGVYVGVGGPHYETPAELSYLRMIGGDAVGMSTVLETIAARHLGLEVMGISLITNQPAAGKASHAEVVEVAGRSAPHLLALVESVTDEDAAGG